MNKQPQAEKNENSAENGAVPMWGKSRQHQEEMAQQYTFPALNKSWNAAKSEESVIEDEQQQFQQGFQQGLQKGFTQGLSEGKAEGYQQGNHEGYAAGKKKGESEGRQVGRALFDTASRPLKEMIEQFRQARHHYEQRRRQELLQLVEKVTVQVIRCELALQPAQLLVLVEEALQAQPVPPEQLKVLLNAEEFERIKEVAPNRVEEWGLVADAELEPGECKVITDSMEIDIGCQHRLQQCMEVLQENLLTEGGEHELQ